MSLPGAEGEHSLRWRALLQGALLYERRTVSRACPGGVSAWLLRFTAAKGAVLRPPAAHVSRPQIQHELDKILARTVEQAMSKVRLRGNVTRRDQARTTPRSPGWGGGRPHQEVGGSAPCCLWARQAPA